MKVIRIYHSGLVPPWRKRDQELRDLGVEVTSISASKWNEAGRDVGFTVGDDPDARSAGVIGRHPYVFLYNPLPIWRVLRRRSVDVLDVHEEPASLATLEVLVLARLAGRREVPVCLYSAQNIEKRYPPPFRWIERWALRHASAVHTCNVEAGRILRRKGFSGILRNLGLGVDVDRFAPPTGNRAARWGPLRVGYVGRLEQYKGVGVLLDAVADVPGLELVAVGDGPEKVALEERAHELDIADRVTLRGFADPDALPDLYRSFDVLAVPSLETPSWIEQFGRVAVEAMAAGVPVVASDSGSLPEVLGDAGVLVPPGDVAALAGALERLRANGSERTRLADAGRRRSSSHSWRAVAERHLALYEEMVA